MLSISDIVNQEIDRRGGKAVASDMGTDPSTVSRIRSGERGILLSQLDALLSSAGYTLVRQDFFDENRRAVKHLASLIEECQGEFGLK